MIVPVPQLTAPDNTRHLNEVNRYVNCYPEKSSEGYQIRKIPGFEAVSNALVDYPATVAIRVLYQGAEKVYSIHSTKVMRFDANGSVTQLSGTIGINYARHMCYGPSQILIVDGENGFSVDLATEAITTISDVNFPANPGYCTYHDSRFIVTDRLTGQFYFSDLNSATDWTPQTFATAESKPDDLIAAISNSATVFMIGRESTEQWVTIDGAIPLSRIPGSTIDVGCVFTPSIAAINNAVIFVGNSNSGYASVWMFEGGAPRKISTPLVEDSIAPAVKYALFTGWGSYPVASAWHEEGHDFYQINFGNTDGVNTYPCWVYDITEGVWHKRVSGSYTFHRAGIILNAYAATFQSGVAAFSCVSRGFMKTGSSYNQDLGTDIVISRRFGPIESGGNRLFHNALRITLDTANDAASAYVVSGVLKWSDDDGFTWSSGVTQSRTTTASTTGQRTRLQWNRLGSANRRFYEVSFTGPSARMAIYNGQIDVTAGRF